MKQNLSFFYFRTALGKKTEAIINYLEDIIRCRFLLLIFFFVTSDNGLCMSESHFFLCLKLFVMGPKVYDLFLKLN